MDKNSIKKYAVWARRELIARVTQRALLYGITDKEIISADATSVNGKVLTAAEKTQRQALISRIQRNGFEQVMEEVAYTWFNRFSALRFMEVNGYLPSHIRVFTDDAGAFKPQILTEAINLELDGLDMEKIYALKDANDNEALFKYLIIVQCNALSAILPGMFQKIDDYTELLFPDNLLREGSAIEQMVTQIAEEDWQDQVQIIGWLYQYYNTEPKDKVFADLKKNIKISKENIPAATQLFTPDWIVRYMVENSLGRLWVEGHPNDELKANWKYYLEEAEQEPEVEAQLAEIRKEYAALTPEQIKCIDPCSGSGHICAYLFDVLVQIYETYGYTAREAVSSIVRNNLYGLDIDERAAQLAYFSVMMKARQYDRRFFSRGIQPHIYAIQESNGIGKDVIDYFVNGDAARKKAIDTIVAELRDAKEYGSILTVTPQDFSALYDRFDEIFDDITMLREPVLNQLLPLVQCAEAMVQKYHVVTTNPPYMGSSNMDARLSDFVKKNYPDSKSDLFAVFIERCGTMTAKNGYQAMITQHAWMFLSSFEKLRAKMMLTDTVNMAHLGARAFEEIGGEVVQTTSFVRTNRHIPDYKATYCRLIEPTTQQGKEDMFLRGENRYTAQQDNFSKIPGSPVAYWVSEKFLNTFVVGKPLTEIAPTRKGMFTGNNDLWLKFWYEINHVDFCTKWKPYNKGGEYRKWYGNNDYVINWELDGSSIISYNGSGNINPKLYFKKCITWSLVTSYKPSFRAIIDTDHVMGDAGPIAVTNLNNFLYLLGVLNSKYTDEVASLIAPTINFSNGTAGNIPIVFAAKEKGNIIERIVSENIKVSKFDWDSFETSWDFKKHPLV